MKISAALSVSLIACGFQPFSSSALLIEDVDIAGDVEVVGDSFLSQGQPRDPAKRTWIPPSCPSSRPRQGESPSVLSASTLPAAITSTVFQWRLSSTPPRSMSTTMPLRTIKRMLKGPWPFILLMITREPTSRSKRPAFPFGRTAWCCLRAETPFTERSSETQGRMPSSLLGPLPRRLLLRSEA